MQEKNVTFLHTNCISIFFCDPVNKKTGKIEITLPINLHYIKYCVETASLKKTYKSTCR